MQRYKFTALDDDMPKGHKLVGFTDHKCKDDAAALAFAETWAKTTKDLLPHSGNITVRVTTVVKLDGVSVKIAPKTRSNPAAPELSKMLSIDTE